VTDLSVMTADTTIVAEWVWKQQSIWSQTANRLKRNLDRSRAIALGLTVAGAVLATAGSQVATISTPAGNALLWAAAVSVGSVPLVRPRFGRGPVEVLARARSASESLKEQVYTYQAAVSPYRETDRDQRLRKQADGTLAAVEDLLPHTAGIEPVSRPLPAVHDVGAYVAIRITGQIHGYYRAQANLLRDRLRWLRGAELVLAVTAAVLSATAASLGAKDAAAWVPVLTSISAALAAHVAATRYEFLLVEYTRTAAQLERLRDRRHSVGAPEQVARADDAFVAECERVISTQNESWMARLTRDLD